jgi:hypothetical protein
MRIDQSFHFRTYMESGERAQLFATFATIHAVLAGGIFANIRPKKAFIRTSLVGTALLLSIAWVVLLTESWAAYPSTDYVAADLIKELSRRSAEVSFLLAGVLAYFSTKAA